MREEGSCFRVDTSCQTELSSRVCIASSSLVFQLLAPAVDWLDYLSSALSPLELNETEPVVLYAREYLQQVSDLINKTDRR